MCNCKKKKCSCSEEVSICRTQDSNYVTCCSPGNLDATQVFYKTIGDCYSNLNFMGIPKGANLEYILERIGYFIENTNYIDVEGNPYGATNFKEYILALKIDIQALKNCCSEANKANAKLLEEIVLIKARLDDLEYPHITDTNGLGFTNTDTNKKVLQTLSDNTQKLNV